MSTEHSAEHLSGIDLSELERRFAELAEADAATREEALRVLARTDPALARRLAALLDAHECHAGEMDRLGASARAALGVFDPEGLMGRELDGWQLTELLGRGGMGVVFGAQRERDGVRQRAAIKLLSIPLFHADAAERFRREALALARLDHPGICRLRDFGRSPEGWPFLVLDRIDGVALHLHAEGRSLTERLMLVARVADAVAAAHRQLVVHLDIKPENVLVTPVGDPVLLDFGIARVLGEEGDASASATVARWLTPDYAAPERLRGEPSTVAADIHSLGALLYRIVTGRKPFDLAGLSVTEAVARIEKGPEPPSRVLGTLPRDLDAVIARAMHPDPARRYASAADFADDLRAIVEHRPVKARPDSLGYRLRTAVRRHPVALPAGLMAGVAIVALAGVLAWQAVGLREQRDRAEREAARAVAASNLLLGSIRAANPLVGQGATMSVADLLKATTDRVGSELAEDPMLHAETLIHLGDAWRGLGQHGNAVPLYERVFSLLDGIDLPDSVDAATWERNRLAAVLGQVEALRAVERVEDALALATSEMGRLRGDRARGHVSVVLARAHLGLGENDKAEPLLRQAMALIPQDASELVPRARAASDLGFIYMARGEHEEALRWFELASSGLHDDPPGRALLASIYGNAAYSLAKLGRMDEALAQGQQGVDMRIKAYGERHVSTVVSLLDQAYVLDMAEKRDEAARVLRRAIAIEASLGDGITRRMEKLNSVLGEVLRNAGKPEEALAPLAESLRIAGLLFPEDSYLRAAPHSNYAGVLADLGDCNTALEHSRIARAIYEANASGGARRGAAITASNLADCHVRLGQGEEALRWSGIALTEARDLPDAQAGILGRIRLVRASALRLAGQLEEALAQVQEVGREYDAATYPVPPYAQRNRLTLLAELHEALHNDEEARAARDRLKTLEDAPDNA